MRILGIRFKNLNSLAGEWHVDFTHPDYSSEGIFAITGPTGAGKTTIMDAVCLGLYGRTPRLDKVTKNQNETMSRQTGECFAEVTFETQKGRFRSHWSQHRARKMPDGELQQARHEIADAASGKVLESKINQVGEFIEKATGMDFERFTRSMLLAQGGFAVFLQAPPNERAPILEQITGTGIYSRISMKVHERRTEENGKLEMLQAGLKGIQVLNEDEERDLGASLRDLQAREIILTGNVEEMNKALAWIEGIFSLEKELVELDRKQQDFEERRQAFAPESGRLERALKALGLEGDYGGVAALRAQQDLEIKELDGTIRALPEKETAAALALAAKQAAESLLREARAGQASAAEVIKRVRDLDARLGEQKKQLDEKIKAIDEIGTKRKSYQSQITRSGEMLRDAQDIQNTVHEYQIQHAADASLLANLNTVEKGFALLRDSGTKLRKAREELSAAAGIKESALAGCAGTEAEHEKRRREFEKKQRELKSLTDEIAIILQGRDISQWRREQETLKDRERLLLQTVETIEGIDNTTEALNGLKKRLDALRTDHAKLSDEIKTDTGVKALLEKDMAALEVQVSLLSRIRDLEEERGRLEDGQPCPLCGATDHPYARGNVPVLNEAEGELGKAKNEWKKISQALSRLEAGQVQTAADIGHAEQQMAEKKAALDADEKRCAAALLALRLEALPDERSGRIREEMAGVQAKIAETSAVIIMAEEKARQEKAAQAALDKTRETFDKAGKALLEARHKLQAAGLEEERLSREVAERAQEAQKIHAAALKDVEPYGIGNIPLDALDTVLKELAGRKEAWRAKEEEKSAREKKIGELKAGMEKDQALLENLERDLEARHKDSDDLKTTFWSLNASRRELFGEKDADREEKRLAQGVDQAGEALERAREAYGIIQKEIGTLKEKIESLKEKTGKRAAVLAAAEQKLMERIERAGFADEADYLSSRLNEEERESIADKERSLIREKTEIDAHRKDKSERLAAEREKYLTDQPVEAIQESIGAGNADLKQVRLDIGGLLRNLSENEKLKEKQQDQLTKMNAQRKECARWEDLHHLIGSADGKKFRNFAQGLTFEMMIAHANRQLGKMTDRYLLVHDQAQPLELNVIDNYQAGEIRSTKNLSGGESFVVSLALALGLSHMASRNVRVDSLFLDEGFGTLDEEALETALETLAGLRQDGKLIGVISHVTALKERIGTKIQVTPGSGGRSTLCGPGCRRI